MIKQLIDMPFLKIQKINYSDDIIRIYASIKSRRSKCPLCGRYSKRVHDYYFRTITDLPVFQNRTKILLRTRKFRCGNPHCSQKVFSEQAPDIIRYSRRTKKATRILETFAIELTGRLGIIISEQLHITVSSSTITRIDFVIRSKRKLAGLKTFARGMLRDLSAVENGINMRWSNGAVEGHVNRIKSIKRQMYGRASFELLRKKVILSRSG